MFLLTWLVLLEQAYQKMNQWANLNRSSNTNLIGTFLICHVCLLHLLNTKGNIVDEASLASDCP